MSPVIGIEDTHMLEQRYCSGYYRYGRCIGHGRFYSWGRWVLLAIIIVAVLFVLFVCTCIARRRRRKGSKPFYGTGWMAPTGGKFGVGNHHNNTAGAHQMNSYGQGGYNQGAYPQGGYNQGWNQQGYNQGAYQSPPAYGQQPQYTGTTFNPNDGYYGNQQYPQQPPNTYQRDVGGDFSPPPGPPPGKHA